MEVNATIHQTVNVNPIEVVQNLIRSEISDGWVVSLDDKYYRKYEVGLGYHSMEEQEEISKEKYEYVMALYLVLNKLKEK